MDAHTLLEVGAGIRCLVEALSKTPPDDNLARVWLHKISFVLGNRQQFADFLFWESDFRGYTAMRDGRIISNDEECDGVWSFCHLPGHAPIDAIVKAFPEWGVLMEFVSLKAAGHLLRWDLPKSNVVPLKEGERVPVVPTPPMVVVTKPTKRVGATYDYAGTIRLGRQDLQKAIGMKGGGDGGGLDNYLNRPENLLNEFVFSAAKKYDYYVRHKKPGIEEYLPNLKGVLPKHPK